MASFPLLSLLIFEPQPLVEWGASEVRRNTKKEKRASVWLISPYTISARTRSRHPCIDCCGSKNLVEPIKLLFRVALRTYLHVPSG